MKSAFERSGARHRRACRNQASFYANRLILVEQMEKNGINKDISAQHQIARPIVTVD